MKIQLAILGLIAAVGFAACETVPTNNATTNRAVANGNTAVVTNTNSTVTNPANAVAPNSNVSGAAVNSNNNSSIDYNKTAKDLENQRASVEAQAKQAGRSIGTGANDWYLWGKTRAQLAATNDLRDSTVDVDLDNAVATLSGTVATAAQKTKAEQVAKSIEGVKSVKNNLTVKAADTVLPNGANTNSNAAPVKKS